MPIKTVVKKAINSIFLPLFLFSVSLFAKPPAELFIFPKPKTIIYKQNQGFQIESQITILSDSIFSMQKTLLQNYLGEMRIAATDIKNNTAQIHLSYKPALKPEEYHIFCQNNLIQIQASNKIGMLHGIQTARQVILQQIINKEKSIPAFQIFDEPQFSWRGMMLDCSRHFMEVNFIKKYIDLLALYKINRFHWHLTDDQGWRVEIKKYPKLTEKGAYRWQEGQRYGGYYTQNQIRDILAYADMRGIIVVPEIEMPGHSQAALASYPELSCTGGPFEVQTEWGVFKDIFCAGEEKSFVFLEDVLTEITDLFPSPYIHVGADEVPKFRWENCTKCQNRIKEEKLKDEHELQAYFLSRIGKFLKSKGKQMIGWDEIMEGGLNKDIIVQSWRGFEGAIQATKDGNAAIVSPTSHAYFDYGIHEIDLEKVYSFHPVPAELNQNEASLILGGSCNLWSERATQNQVDGKVFPRLIAMASTLWSGDKKSDFRDFQKNLQHHYPLLDFLEVKYGPESVYTQIDVSGSKGYDYRVKIIQKDPAIKVQYQCNQQRKKVYKNPISIQDSTKLHLSFYRNTKELGYGIEQTFVPHLAVGKNFQYKHPISSSLYAGQLNDGKLGSIAFKDGNWQGTWGEPIEIEIDLERLSSFSQVQIHFLQYINAWIFLPTEVKIAWAGEDKIFKDSLSLIHSIPIDQKGEFIHCFQTKGEFKARYLKINAYSIGNCPAWHDAAGSKSWLFVDECIIK